MGKTFAYAVHALKYAQAERGRVIISSASKMLQNQLERDLPLLCEKLGIPMQVHVDNEHGLYDGPFFMVSKGNANYVCPVKAYKKRLSTDFQKWLSSTRTGDLTEAPQPLPPEILYGSNAENCVRKGCPMAKDCVFAARKIGRKMVPVLVVNHALLAMDLQFQTLLGDYDLVILDEAHEAESYFRNSFKDELTWKGLDSALARAQHVDTGIVSEQERKDIGFKLLELFDILESANKGEDVNPGLAWSIKDLKDVEIGPLINRLSQVCAKLRDERDVHEGVDHNAYLEAVTALRRVGKQRDALMHLVKFDTEHEVAYIEGTKDYRKLCVEQIEIGTLVHELLFNRKEVVVCTSGTIAQGDKVGKRGEGFSYFRDQIGAWHPNTIMDICPSSFNFDEQARIYLPTDLPEYYYQGKKYDDWAGKLSLRIYELIHASKGGVFVLFSSRRDMEKVAAIIGTSAGNIGDHPFWLQEKGAGGQDTEAALRWFQAEHDRVIFGLKRFWTGVSIEGDALRHVIIPKLPFPAPDPLLEARKNKSEKAGENWFAKIMIPGMIADVKQGTGRLIRTRTDRGVVSILDPRIHTKRYGIEVKAALPFKFPARSVEDVAAFFATRF